MHLPDGILSGPVIAVTAVGAVGTLAVCVKRMERAHGDRATLLAGMIAAFVFAAQMVNFRVLPGASGHLIGGVLASVVLGPWAGAVAIAAVLLVQAFLFADGGVTALGANFVNMGLINTILGYVIYRELRRVAGGGHRGTIIGAVGAAWVGVILSATAGTVELAASGRWSAFLPLLGVMLLVHAIIGLGESLITGLVVQSMLAVRPDLIPDPEAHKEPAGMRVGRIALAGLSIAVAVAVFLGPLASAAPDGLEYSVSKLGIDVAGEQAAPPTAVMPDYQAAIPGIQSIKIATAVAGAAGSLLVFAIAGTLGFARLRTARLAGQREG